MCGRFASIRSGRLGASTKQSLQLLIDSKGVTAHQGNVVRQAGMPDRVILREQCIFLRKFVVRWHLWIVDHRTKFLVLEHDDDDMLEVRNKRVGCSCWAWGWSEE